MNLNFTKLHGAGNDFIFVDGRTGLPDNIPSLARQLCNRHLGIGGDGLIFLCPSDEADLRMHYSNSDGTPTTCGNGVRLLGRYAEILGVWKPEAKSLSVDTVGGIVRVERTNQLGVYRVNMGRPRFDSSDIPFRGVGEVIQRELKIANTSFLFSAVSMGNPHCVIFVPEIDSIPLEEIGPKIENSILFPEKTNVAFVQILSPDSVRMRVWERAVGITLACGTANCAILAVGAREGFLKREIELEAPGGKFLVAWDNESDEIYLTGPTAVVFSGEINISN